MTVKTRGTVSPGHQDNEGNVTEPVVDYCWTLQRDCHQKHTRQSHTKPFFISYFNFLFLGLIL